MSVSLGDTLVQEMIMSDPVDLNELPTIEEHARTHRRPSDEDIVRRYYVLNPHPSGAWICSDCHQLIRPRSYPCM